MNSREEAYRIVCDLFPKLSNDPSFAITSREDCNYNCIAWASFYDNVWIWPILNPPQYKLDGVKIDWPLDIPVNEELETFIKFFNKLNYCEETDNHLFVDGFQKIAIFTGNDNKVTHAARQKILNGKWASKLGKSFDIEHASPYDLEGDEYGKIAKLLIRPFSKAFK